MNIAVLLAGGIGTRLKSEIPKQYIKVNNKMIITYTAEQLLNSTCIDGIVIAADNRYHKIILDELGTNSISINKFMGFAKPGNNRQESVYNALVYAKDICPDIDYVMIHDAARPKISQKLIKDCFDKVVGHDGVMPVLPMKDTVYLCEDGNSVSGLLDRSKIYAGQAPEVFVFSKYLEANKKLLPDRIFSINGSSEPAVLAGMDIAVIRGEEDNFKITTENDLKRFEEIVL